MHSGARSVARADEGEHDSRKREESRKVRVKSSVPKSSAAPQHKAADRATRGGDSGDGEIFADLHLVDLKSLSEQKLGSSKITRIIHQTWKDEDSVPPQMAAFSAGWRKLHPDWEYRLWTDESIDAFVAKEFPQLYGIFESYPWQIQRVDFARYCILKKFGGLFVDMDFEALRPFDAVIARSALDVHHRKSKQGERSWSWAWPSTGASDELLVLTNEPHEHAAKFGRQSILSNAIMYSSPEHPVWKHVLAALAEAFEFWEHRRAQGQDSNQQDAVTMRGEEVVWSTGPLLLTFAIEAMERQGQDLSTLRRLSPEVAMPIQLDFAGERDSHDRKSSSGKAEHLCKPIRVAERIRKSAYAVHHWCHTWW
eukprot:g4361.t1